MHVAPHRHKAIVCSISLVALSLLFIAILVAPQVSTQFLQHLQHTINTHFSWFYMLSIVFFIGILLYCLFSKVGHLVLGKAGDRPEFGFFSWCSMLFGTGMGIGLVFFGVAEPVLHYIHPPIITGQTEQAVQQAMTLTFFHWGISAWSIYAIVGLVVAYSAYRNDLSIEMRSALYPLVGNKIYGPIGQCADVFAVLATVVGIVTPLGFGVQQLNAGLSYVMGVPNTMTSHVILIIVIALVTCLSVILGLKKGIKWLSIINIVVAVLLMLGVFMVSDKWYILTSGAHDIVHYISHIVPLSFENYSNTNPQWFYQWTLFYWAWWIAFAAPTGLFIARISKGRTIREFVLGVLVVPVAFSLIWIAIFGNSALDMIHHHGAVELSDAVVANASTALFKFFAVLSHDALFSPLALFSIFAFFVTTSDSGTLVINELTCIKGSNAPIIQRVFWVGIIAVMTILLLSSGGMGAIQAVLVILGCPFALLLTVMCVGFLKDIFCNPSTKYDTLQAAKTVTH